MTETRPPKHAARTPRRRRERPRAAGQPVSSVRDAARSREEPGFPGLEDGGEGERLARPRPDREVSALQVRLRLHEVAVAVDGRARPQGGSNPNEYTARRLAVVLHAERACPSALETLRRQPDARPGTGAELLVQP